MVKAPQDIWNRIGYDYILSAKQNYVREFPGRYFGGATAAAVRDAVMSRLDSRLDLSSPQYQQEIQEFKMLTWDDQETLLKMVSRTVSSMSNWRKIFAWETLPEKHLLSDYADYVYDYEFEWEEDSGFERFKLVIPKNILPLETTAEDVRIFFKTAYDSGTVKPGSFYRHPWVIVLDEGDVWDISNYDGRRI